MVVVIGATVTGVPLVTVIAPGEIDPVPPVKVAVRLAGDPGDIVPGVTVKPVITGTGLTVMAAGAVTAVPVEGVTVRV